MKLNKSIVSHRPSQMASKIIPTSTLYFTLVKAVMQITVKESVKEYVYLDLPDWTLTGTL